MPVIKVQFSWQEELAYEIKTLRKDHFSSHDKSPLTLIVKNDGQSKPLDKWRDIFHTWLACFKFRKITKIQNIITLVTKDGEKYSAFWNVVQIDIIWNFFWLLPKYASKYIRQIFNYIEILKKPSFFLYQRGLNTHSLKKISLLSFRI